MTKKSLPAPRKPDSFDFAGKMQELQALVMALETDNDIEKAMQQFEKASKIAAELQTYLDTAENSIKTIEKNFKRSQT